MHQTSSSYWPKGSGRVESAVKIVKNMMKKCDEVIQKIQIKITV